MKKAWLALVFGSALFLAACGGGDEANNTDTNKDNTEETTNNNQGTTDNNNNGSTTNTADEATVAEGQAVVEKACISCHGQNLEGMGNFPALNNVGSRLTQEEILSVIQNGKGIMSANIVKGEAAEAAAAYLATLK